MTEDELLARLKQTCVQLPDPSGGDGGSGYLVSRGRAATANHVVKNWVDGENYSVAVGWGEHQRSAIARVRARDVARDAALLEIDGCEDIEALQVGELPAASVPWHGFGFPAAARKKGVPTGLPIRGTVDDANWQNAKRVHQILLSSVEASTGAATGTHGFSGSPVTVEGALVGHLIEQFGDPNDTTRPAFGKLKACPIHVVNELLDVPPVFAQPRPRLSAKASAPLLDADIPELMAWCDRAALCSRIHDWLSRSTNFAGLLCLIGHPDTRPRLLLDRIVQQLAEEPPQFPGRAIHILKEHEPNDDRRFREAALGAVGVARDVDVPAAQAFRDGAHLLLLCHYSDCSGWDAGQAQAAIIQAARWVSGLSTGSRRLVLVMTMRYAGKSSLVDWFRGRAPRVERLVTEAYKRVAQDSKVPLSRVALGDPLVLGDYSIEHLRNWRELARVREGLGLTAAALDEGVFEGWFSKPTRSHGELVKDLQQFHENYIARNGMRSKEWSGP